MARWKIILRWTLCVPVAAGSAWLAWFIVATINRLALASQLVSPDGVLSHAFTLFISHLAMGAAFVYVGAKIAPSHKSIVGLVLAVLGLVFAGYIVTLAVSLGEYRSLWGVAALIFGLGIVVYADISGELEY